MIDGRLAAFAESNDVTDLGSPFIYRCHACDIVVILKGCDYGLKCLNVGIHLLTLLFQRLERRPGR